jgi:hypothetical protein
MASKKALRSAQRVYLLGDQLAEKKETTTAERTGRWWGTRRAVKMED